MTRIAPVLTFTDANFYLQQTIELTADTSFVLPPGREDVKVFPASTHLLSKLRGPLAVEGGVAVGADRSLHNGVKLPGEKDGPLFNIAAQAPESSQIDVLNVFNDSSQADTTGAMTSTTMTGFGMAKDLDFHAIDPSITAGAYGESLVVPGGISFGAINALGSGGSYSTNLGKSTIEVVNVMLGEGNDNLTITGTIDPLVSAAVTASMTLARIADLFGGTVLVPGISLTRSAGSWLTDGYTVGQQVTVSGLAGRWQVVDITSPTTLVLRPLTATGATVPAAGSTGSFTVTPVETVTWSGTRRWPRSRRRASTPP